MKFTKSLLVLAMVLLAPPAALADPVYSVSGSGVWLPQNQCSIPLATGNTTVQSGAGCTSGVPSFTGSVAGGAGGVAGAGFVGAFTTSSGVSLQPDINMAASVQAQSRDTLVVTGGTGTGFLVFNTFLDGAIVGAPCEPVNCYSVFNLQFQLASINGIVLFYSITGDPTRRTDFQGQFSTIAVPFVFGQPLPLQMGISLGLAVENASYTFSEVLFGNTGRIVGTEVYDSAMNPISNAVITSDSGFDYLNPSWSSDPPPAPVPEPGTLALFGTGALSLAGMIRRRRGRWNLPLR